MIDNLTLCPYSGLRSFSEDESLFFKGRDTHIDKVTRLLERNKFLMVTGASGEGKSSLIYAGLIPNARAGFFKARFSKWTVVDFRPERTPLRNFAKALADQFNPGQTGTFETEIRRGFSSLVELYKNSPLYGSQDEVELAKQGGKRASHSNLLIIADQFEEFFTNPENFVGGTPSEEAQTVVNLMLETAKIALMEDLPIYVVCTMRSDYIGQCTAFRGLPEYIGFSQFFVPRLKRNELQQVIEEPALLNGNRISRRLTERLLFDLSEGIDQLPILQHALSQIWLEANKGEEEMDLIHYAKVGGMPSDELPESDQKRFDEWFGRLPDFMKPYYQRPAIQRILEIHANRLYEEAWSYVSSHSPAVDVTVKDVKNCVALIFACLTKIDDTRAVRNRMTVAEISNIINQPHITPDVVTAIVNSFREEGNSFIRPYLLPDAESRSLHPDTVLDITHESLIRNWDRLKRWADKEYEYYSDFLDFEKQLNRWLDHGKSSNFLLPIGPLTYFETWYASCRPNKYWINRYEGKIADPDSSLTRSATILQNTEEFLKKSARKVMFARTVMRYGASRIVAMFAIVALVALSSFYFYDAEVKRNSHVLDRLDGRARELMTSGDIDPMSKAWYLLVKERLSEGAIFEFLNEIPESERQTDGRKVYETLLAMDKESDHPLKDQLATFIDQMLEEQEEPLLAARNNFMVLLAYDRYYRESGTIDKLLAKNAQRVFAITREFFKNPDRHSSVSYTDVNMAINLFATFGDNTIAPFNELISAISPFASSDADSMFHKVYPYNQVELNGRIKINYNGGYHTLAVLYAATGNLVMIERCMEKLYENVDYFLGNPFNNYTNIIGYLYQYGHRREAVELIRWIANKTNSERTGVYLNVLDRAGFLRYLYASNIDPSLSEANAGYCHPNLSFLNPQLIEMIFDDFEKEINSVGDPSKRNYLLAMAKKQRAVYLFKHRYDRKLSIEEENLAGLLDEAVDHFSRTSDSYLDERITVSYRYYGGGIRSRPLTRRQQFIYPDYLGGTFSNTYYGDLFFRYMLGNNLLERYYQTRDDLQLLNFWISNYREVYTRENENAFKHDYPLPVDHFIKIREFIKNHPARAGVDMNLINVELANDFFTQGDSVNALVFFHDMNLDALQPTANMFDYLNKAYFLNALKNLSIQLARYGHLEEAAEISSRMGRDSHVIQNYIFVADALYDTNFRPEAFAFLDSAFHKMESIHLIDLQTSEDFRFTLLYVLGKIGGQELDGISWNVLRSVDEWNKFWGINSQVAGVSRRQNYFQAAKKIPANLTDTEELICYTQILYTEARGRDNRQSSKWSGMDSMWDHMMFYSYNSRFLN